MKNNPTEDADQLRQSNTWTEDQLRQMNFVQEHCRLLELEFIQAIAAQRVPPEFDGHELRVWMADRFEESARLSNIRQHPSRRRAQIYRIWRRSTPVV